MAQTPQSFRYSHTQSMDADEDSRPKFRSVASLDMSAWSFNYFFKINFFKKFFQEHLQSDKWFGSRSDPEVIKLSPCSTQLSVKLILLINVKMPTVVGIFTFVSMINTTPERLKETSFVCRYFSFYQQLKFRAQLS